MYNFARWCVGVILCIIMLSLQFDGKVQSALRADELVGSTHGGSHQAGRYKVAKGRLDVLHFSKCEPGTTPFQSCRAKSEVQYRCDA